MTPQELTLWFNNQYTKEFARLKRQIDLLYAELSREVKKEIQSTRYQLNGKYDSSNSSHKPLLDSMGNNLDTLVDRTFIQVENEFQTTMESMYNIGYNGVKHTIKNPVEESEFVYQTGRSVDMQNPWSGVHYTERLESHKAKLKFNLKANVKGSIVRGETFGVNYNEAYKAIQYQLSALDRLCKTEMNVMKIMGQIHCYKQNGIVKVRCIQDQRCCDVCKAHDGEEVQVSRAKVGVNIPSWHTSCRCYIEEVTPNK